MIDVDSMKSYVRAANPVPDPEDLDPDELARFVAMAEVVSSTSTFVEAEPVRRQPTRRRGPAVAVATAAVVLGAVALAVVLAGPFGEGSTVGGEPSPTTTGQPDVTSAFRNPALFTKRLVPTQAPNPDPISTVIGDLEFEMLEFESGAYGLYRVAWTPHGLVAAENDRLYWSTDYYTWQSLRPSVPADSVAVVDDDIVVHGPGGTVRYGWGGAGWIETGTLDVSGVDRLVFGPSGVVAVAGDSLWYSTDGVQFSRAEQAPSPDLLAASSEGWCPDIFGPLDPGSQVLATETGYVALTATSASWFNQHPICEPVLWISADGNEWDLVSDESPFGESAAVYEVAEREGQFVAVGAIRGATAVAWVSDDGLAWEQIDFDLQFIDSVAGGELGWVITGASAVDEQLIFFSADGRTWDGPYERPEAINTGYMPPQIAVGDDVIFGIGGSGNDALLARLQD